MTYQTANKINALYADETVIDWRNSEAAIDQTLSILSAGRLSSALVYTGTAKTSTNIHGLLALYPNIKKRIYAIIYVDYRDEYNIDYVQINSDEAIFISRQSGIFVAELSSAYEQIYDNYINTIQAGFIEI